MVEFGLVALLMFVLIAGLVDTSFLLINYIKLEQAVREGGRTASSNATIFPGPFTDHDTLTHITDCNIRRIVVPSATLDCGTVLVHARTRHILEMQYDLAPGHPEKDRVKHTLGSGAVIQSEFTDGGVGPNADTYEISVTTSYRTFFGFFGTSMPMTATYRAPWLFRK